MADVLGGWGSPIDARRAPRYAVVAPVRYCDGTGEWVDAMTMNMSRLGLAMRTRCGVPPPGTSLELRVALSASDAHLALHGAEVACRGSVVWTARTSVAGEFAVATTIDAADFEPAGTSNPADAGPRAGRT